MSIDRMEVKLIIFMEQEKTNMSLRVSLSVDWNQFEKWNEKLQGKQIFFICVESGNHWVKTQLVINKILFPYLNEFLIKNLKKWKIIFSLGSRQRKNAINEIDFPNVSIKFVLKLTLIIFHVKNIACSFSIYHSASHATFSSIFNCNSNHVRQIHLKMRHFCICHDINVDWNIKEAIHHC